MAGSTTVRSRSQSTRNAPDAGARERVVGERLEGDPPVVVAVGLDRGEARGRAPTVGRARASARAPPRPSVAASSEHDAGGDDQARPWQPHARPSAGAPARLAPAEPEAAASRRGHEHERAATSIAAPSALAWLPVSAAHRRQQRRPPPPATIAEGDERAGHAQLRRASARARQHHEPDRQRGQRAARERQVDAQAERRRSPRPRRQAQRARRGWRRPPRAREHEARSRPARPSRSSRSAAARAGRARCASGARWTSSGSRRPEQPVADDDQRRRAASAGSTQRAARPRAEQRRGGDQRAEVERARAGRRRWAAPASGAQASESAIQPVSAASAAMASTPGPARAGTAAWATIAATTTSAQAAMPPISPRLVEVAAGEEGDGRRPGEQSAGGEGADGIHDGGASAAAAARSSASVRVCAVGPVSRRARRSEGRSITYQLTAAIPTEMASAIEGEQRQAERVVHAPVLELVDHRQVPEEEAIGDQPYPQQRRERQDPAHPAARRIAEHGGHHQADGDDRLQLVLDHQSVTLGSPSCHPWANGREGEERDEPPIHGRSSSDADPTRPPVALGPPGRQDGQRHAGGEGLQRRRQHRPAR